MDISEGASVKYFKLEGMPGLQIQEGRVCWWDPISTQTRSRDFFFFTMAVMALCLHY